MADTQTLGASPLAKSPVRVLLWRRPDGHANHPPLIEAMVSKLRNAADSRRGPLWDAISDATRVFDPPRPVEMVLSGVEADNTDMDDDDEDTIVWDPAAPPALDRVKPSKPLRIKGAARPRTRQLRSDGGVNLITALTTWVWNADFSSPKSRGFVGRPIASASWERHGVGDLDFYAYGPLIPGQRSRRRMERHMRTLIDAGFLTVHQMRTLDRKTGEIRSETAIKAVTEKLLKFLGVFGMWKRSIRQMQIDTAEKEAEKIAGVTNPRREQLAKGRRRRGPGAGAKPAENLARTTGPPAVSLLRSEFDPPDPAQATADSTIASIKKILGLKR